MDVSKVIFDVKIPKSQWPDLRALYGLHWPRHILTSYTLNNYIEWTSRNRKLDVTIFTSDYEWERHGTFVLVEKSGAGCNVFFNTLKPEENQELLLEAFKCLLLDRAFTLAAFVNQVMPIVVKFMLSEDLTRQNSCEKILFYLPMKQSLELVKRDAPGYNFKSLSLHEIPVIDQILEHRYSESLLENIIHYNLTLGVYEKKTGSLCGWIMQEPWGTMGMLHVLNSFKERGLGEQLVLRMAMLLANAGMDASAVFHATSRCHRHLFHKLGFRIINKAFWYDVIPTQKLRDYEKKGPGSEVLSTLLKKKLNS